MLTLLRGNRIPPGWLAAFLSCCLTLPLAPQLAHAQTSAAAPKVNYLAFRTSSFGATGGVVLPAKNGLLYGANHATLAYVNTYPSPVVAVLDSGVKRTNCHISAGLEPEFDYNQGILQDRLDYCASVIGSPLRQSALTGYIYASADLQGTYPIECDPPYTQGCNASQEELAAERYKRGWHRGNLVRYRPDGGDGRVVEASFTKLSTQVTSSLVLGQTADGHDIVYGMDIGGDGKGRIWSVEYADDDARARFQTVYLFETDADGFPVALNDMILASDGYLYVLLAYWRGDSAIGAPGMRSDPDTPTGAIIRLHPGNPGDTVQTVRRFILSEGEPTYSLATNYLTSISHLDNGVPKYYHENFSPSVVEAWRALVDINVECTPTAWGNPPCIRRDPSPSWRFPTHTGIRSTLVEGPDGYIYGNLGFGVCQHYVKAPIRALIEGGLTGPIFPGCITGNKNFFDWQPAADPSTGEVDAQGRPIPKYDGYYLDAQGQRQVNYGAIYRVGMNAAASGAGAGGFPFQILHRFGQTDGVNPKGPMAIGGDGAIYGVTLAGGAWREHFYFDDGKGNIVDDVSRMFGQGRRGDGTLYRIVPSRISIDAQGQVADGGFESLHTFIGNGEMHDRITGRHPIGVSAGPDGNLYGVTVEGGRWNSDQYGPLPDPRLGGSNARSNGVVFQVDLSGMETEASITVGLNPPVTVTGSDTRIVWQGVKVANCVGMGGYEGSGWAGPHAPEGELKLSNVPVAPNGAAYNFYMACDATDATDANGNPKKVYSAYAQLLVNMPTQEVLAERQGYGNGGSSAPWPLALLGIALWLRRRSPSIH